MSSNAGAGRIAQINADKRVDLAVHLGDIKSGSSKCTDEYFAKIKGYFDTFNDPLVYIPGDNEWTDCHRTNNGPFSPLDRLSKIRQLFFPEPGRTLGQRPITVASQADQGYPENVSYQRGGVCYCRRTHRRQ